MGQSREHLYSSEMWHELGDWSAYDEITLPLDKLKRWHPLNQSLYVGYKVHLAGLLLSGKGDRTLRTASTEGRYPFLDEQVTDFCAVTARIQSQRPNGQMVVTASGVQSCSEANPYSAEGNVPCHNEPGIFTTRATDMG